MTRLMFVSTVTLPSPLANRQYVMWMCEAFTRFAQVTLCVNQVQGSLDEVYAFYNVRSSFEIRPVGPVWRPRSFWLSRRYARMVRHEAPNLVYTCEVKLLGFMQAFAPMTNYMYETENLSSELKRYVRHLNDTRGIVCYNSLLKTTLTELGVEPKRILVAPSGVRLEGYDKAASPEDLRRELGLPLDMRIVMYVGHFQSWKGVETLIHSARMLNGRIAIYLVGGMEPDASRIGRLVSSNRIQNVHLIPFQPPGRVPKFLQAADVLVLPNNSSSEYSANYTSPLKLFQYMASGRPIVASDLPSLRQILGPHNAFMVKPDDPEALALGIAGVLRDETEARLRAERARQRALTLTWEDRARRILEFATIPTKGPR
ncbi:MAG: glycosyltransferase [bacterium]